MARYSLDDLVQGLIQRGLSGEALARAIAISARENGMQGGDTGNLNKSEPANVAAMGPFQFVAGSHPDFNRQTAKDNLDYQLDYANRYFRSNDFSPWTVAPLPGGGYGFSQALANDFTNPQSQYRQAAQAAIDRVQSGNGKFTYYANAKAPTQNVSKAVATTQQDSAAQQQFGKNYADLTPVQKYAIDAQSGVGASGGPATLYNVDDVLKAGGKWSSTGNTVELKIGSGRGSPTIYFYPTTDANGRPTGQLQAPQIYANGSNTPTPYTGALPAGLKPVQGGGTPTAQGGTQQQQAPQSGGTGGASTPPKSVANAAVKEAPGITPPPNMQTSAPGGGLGGLLANLTATGGPSGTGPYSLTNPAELARLAGLSTDAASEQGVTADIGSQIADILKALTPATNQQFTQTGGGAPVGDVAQSATLANGQQAGSSGGGAKAAGVLGGAHISPPSLPGGGLLNEGKSVLGDIADAGIGAADWLGRQLGIDGGGKPNGFTANAAVDGQPQADAAVSSVGAPSQFTQVSGSGPVASAEVSGRNNGNSERANANNEMGLPGQFTGTTASPGNALASGGAGAGPGLLTPPVGVGSSQPGIPDGAITRGTPFDNQKGFVPDLTQIAKYGSVTNPAQYYGPPANLKISTDAGGAGGDEVSGSTTVKRGQFTNTDVSPEQMAQFGFGPGISGFADGGEVQAGTNNPVGIFDLLTGRPIAVAGEAGRENVKVTPMKKGGSVKAGSPGTSYPNSQWSTGPRGQPEPFFAAGGAEFGVGNDIPQAGVGFSGPKQQTGYEALSYYSRPNSGLNPYPVPMEGPYGPPRGSSGGGLSGTSNLLSSLLGGSSAPKLPSYIRTYGGGRDPNTRATLPTYYMDTRTGKSYDSAHLVPEQLADGGEFTVGSEDPSQSVFNTGYPNAGMAMHPDNTGLLRAMSSLMPVSGSQTQSDVDKSIQGMMASLGMGPSQPLGNSGLKTSLSQKLGLSPRAGAAMGLLTGSAT